MEMNVYRQCPAAAAGRLLLRLVRPEDSQALFSCYHDQAAVARMNDDNCDFGFYVESQEQMRRTVDYWLDYYGQGAFVRFAVVDEERGQAVGTIEGFSGEEGVLRIDLASAYERAADIVPLLDFAQANFRAYFGNVRLVTKAPPQAAERRKALERAGWRYIGSFRGYDDYYQAITKG